MDTLFASTKALLRTLDDRAHEFVAARTYSTQEPRDSKYSKPSPPSAQHTPTLLPPDIGNNSTHIEAEWKVELLASATAATELTNSKRAGRISFPPAPLGTKRLHAPLPAKKEDWLRERVRDTDTAEQADDDDDHDHDNERAESTSAASSPTRYSYTASMP